MTKPSYEELDRPKDLQPAFDLWLAAQQFYASVNSGTQQQITESSSRLREMLAKTEDTFNSWELCNKYDGLESELARVRGLLQRLVGIAAKVARREYLPSLEQCRTIRHAHHEIERYDSFHAELAQQLAAIALSQGAESADIGKLDTADEKIDGRGDDVVIGAESNVADLIAPPLRNERPSTISSWGARKRGERRPRMTKHSKVTCITDSACNGVAQTIPSEIRKDSYQATQTAPSKPFYWVAAPSLWMGDRMAPTGWYRWLDNGLVYLGESILEK